MIFEPCIGAGVLVATAATDAAYVKFTASVVSKRPLSAANWSGIWYMLSSFAVISYTNNWVYVGFAIVGSWIGAYVTLKYFHHEPGSSARPLEASNVIPRRVSGSILKTLPPAECLGRA